MGVAANGALKILGSARFRTFRCLWMMEELGLSYEHIPSASPQSEEVKRYNPLGKVPVLIENDTFVLYESGAIVTYLGDRYGNSLQLPLVPKAGTRERGLYDQTMSVLLTELDAQGLWIHTKHEQLGEYFTFVPEAVAHAKKYFSKTNRVLVQQIQNGGPYLLGPTFSGVDIVYVHCLDWSKSIGWNDKWKDESTLQSYLERCKSRLAYETTKEIRTNEKVNLMPTTDAERGSKL
jgi:glutathione S-transferase